MDGIYLGGLAFAVCAAFLFVLISVAPRLGLIDQPSGRKQHGEPTPIVGGIAIYLAVGVTVFFAPEGTFSFTLLGWFGVVLVVGVLDDLFDVSYRIRLLCHACVAVGIFFTSGLFVGDIGAITGDATVRMGGSTAVIFTIVGVVGVVNAVNMSDGVDGLLGGQTIVSLGVVFLFAMSQSNFDSQISSAGIAMLIGAMVAFLLFNSRILKLKRALVFMGDAGSTTLGFILAYLLIDYSQGSAAPISPVVAGWIIGLPLLDASGVILYRVLSGRSPFHPDRNHFHHLLMDANYSVNQTVITLGVIHLSLIAVGLTAHSIMGDASEMYLFGGFVLMVVCRAVAVKIYEKAVVAKSDVHVVRQVTSPELLVTRPNVSTMVGTTTPQSRDLGELQKSDAQ